MLNLKKLTIRNFMSVGAIPQTVDFDSGSITLILGENLDMVADNQNIARNGAGKSSILAALSFGLFGHAISNIKRENLINNINLKNMLVTVDFDANGHSYRIERGRKPNIFKFFVDATEVNTTATDEAQGESKHTQEEIEKIIGMSHTLFKHIIVLNTNTEPFLKLPSGKQRELIEELLGMKMLTEKAESLKVLRDYTKSEITIEETKIRTIQETNKKIEKSIEDIFVRAEQWTVNRDRKLVQLQEGQAALYNVDVEQEIASHKQNAEHMQIKTQLDKINREISVNNSHMRTLEQSIAKTTAQLEKALDHSCPTCNQEIQDEHHNAIVNGLAEQIAADSIKLDSFKSKLEQWDLQKTPLMEKLAKLPIKNTFYQDVSDAYDHKTSVGLCAQEIASLQSQSNPHEDQIDALVADGLQDINYDEINSLSKVRDHQEFLLKLLTSNDSFVRKKIIDQNVAFLNFQMAKYLSKLALPHNVTFLNDLSVQITNFGREMDFQSLSRGEQSRLILSLSLSFRDIYEILNHPVNAVIIDEILDLGGDQQFSELALGILRDMNSKQAKNIWLISHRDDLASKIPSVMRVTKEGGFTSLELVNDYLQ